MRNGGHIALGKSRRNRPHFDRVVGLNDVGKAALRAALQGGGWNDGRILAYFQQQADIHKLVRPEITFAIVEDGLQLARARGLVNLIIYGQQVAACQPRLVITAVGLHF